MNATRPQTNHRTRALRRALPLLAAGALLVGCGSTHVTAAGGGPGPTGAGSPGVIGPAPTTRARTTPAPTGPVPTRPMSDTLTGIPLPAPTPTPTPVCSPEGVMMAAGEVEAAMGLRAMTVRLTNCGTRPYRLNGHPGVRVLGAERAPLDIGVRQGAAGIATVEGFDAPGSPLTLQPQEAAEFKLLWRNTVAAGDRAPDDGRYLDIAPQPGRPRLAVPAHLDLGTTGRLGISAWAKSAAR
ncbi:hypothetical protein P3T27_000640 [Kitasatospora sp. MAA19]|uniref:DUF4232 domain-containing protein n=1 Tax=Kitasatospora sp. MAA19 TaxID=3035090 RepID=UPI002475DCA3|nr:DUF4232 domain-containing protein [Kitasatospora sp. MAA19]MDH6703939.1 hypothetical protein [Kitasatospora sp. MAA19]